MRARKGVEAREGKVSWRYFALLCNSARAREVSVKTCPKKEGGTLSPLPQSLESLRRTKEACHAQSEDLRHGHPDP